MDSKDLFRDKKVTVIGLARSGEAAVRLLCKLGAHVLASDQKDEEQLGDTIAILTNECPGIRFYLGGHPSEIVEDVDLVVISPGVPTNIPVLVDARRKGIPVIGEVELAYRVCRSAIIAITGTKGKSTTSTLLGQILSKGFKGSNIVIAGNIGSPLSKYVLGLTESDLLVLEISSFQLETTFQFRPRVSVILNIMRDHFDRHSSMEDYVSAKYRIFANQTEDDYTVLNADDPIALACAKRTSAKVILFSSQKKLDAGVYLENGKIVANLWHDDPVAICGRGELRIPGRHNLENAMAAVAVGMIYNVQPSIMRDVLKSFSGLEHALELVDEVNGVKFINDSKATNVISLKAALESLNGRVILIMGGRDKGNDYSPLVDLVREKVKYLILLGESAGKIEDWFRNYDDRKERTPHRATTMEDAVFMAYELAEPGDVVLLSPACASFDMFRDYAERGNIFKEAVKKIVTAERA